MYRQSCQPLFAAYNDGSAHQVVIHNVCKVVGRNTVRLEDDNILVVLGDFHLALDQVFVTHLVLNTALRAETDNVRGTLGQLCLDVLHRTVTPYRILAVVAKVFLCSFLLLTHSCQLFLGCKARICHAALYERLDESLVNLSALRLTVRAVCTAIFSHRCALVKGQTERGKCVDDGLYAALDLALLIGILNAQVEHAARLMCQTLINQCAVQVAQMHKTGRARAHTGYLRTLRQLTCRVLRQNILRGLSDVRKQLFREQIIIHGIAPSPNFKMCLPQLPAQA